MKRTQTPVEASKVPQAQHFTTLRASLKAGILGQGTQGRRLINGLADSSALSWQEMARIGNIGQQARGFSRKPSR